MPGLSHFFRSALLIPQLLLLFGCSEPQKGLPYAIEISDGGAGPVRPGTPFDAAAVTGLLPGFDAVTYTAFLAGVPQRIIRVGRGNVPVMTLSPTPDGKRIASIAVVHPDTSVNGERCIGRLFGDFFRDGSACTFNAPELLCRVPGAERLYYRFRLSAETLPHPDLLLPLEVEAVIWKNDA